MISSDKIDALIERIISSLPKDVILAKQDLEKNLKAAISAGLSKMELVTREEYDVQVALLQRTREKLETLERKLADLEEQLQAK